MTPAQGRTMYVCPLANAQVQVAPEEESRVMDRRHSDFSLLNSDLGARPHPIEEDDCHECMRAQGKRCCAALFPAPCAAILHYQINAFLDPLHPSLLNPTCMPNVSLARGVFGPFSSPRRVSSLPVVCGCSALSRPLQAVFHQRLLVMTWCAAIR